MFECSYGHSEKSVTCTRVCMSEERHNIITKTFLLGKCHYNKPDDNDDL